MATTGLDPQNTGPRNEVDRLRRWADIVVFAIDNPGREAVDALLELSAELEACLEAAIREAAAA